MGFKIYKILCSENGKMYVGYTGKTVEERFKNHLDNARWDRKTALYDAIRVYGESCFSVEFVMDCETHEQACAEERRIIAELNSMLPNGYNMTAGGDGVPLSPELHKKAGDKKRGRFTEKQWEAALRRRGVKLSPEHILKVAAKHVGSKRSEETRVRMSEAQRLRWAYRSGGFYSKLLEFYFSPSSEMNSIKYTPQKKKIHGADGKKFRRGWVKGRPRSEESKKKISEGMKAYRRSQADGLKMAMKNSPPKSKKTEQRP